MSNKDERQTVDIEPAGRRLGIGRTLSYELARTGRFPVPVIRVGRRYVVSRARLDALLGESD